MNTVKQKTKDTDKTDKKVITKKTQLIKNHTVNVKEKKFDIKISMKESRTDPKC